MENIFDRDINEVTYNNMMEYNQSVITDRALPNVYDGLKPVQRRILYTMYRQKYFSTGKFVKSARVTGDVIAILHPHSGDSVYETCINLLKDYTNNQPTIEGHGSFANILDPTSSSSRYSELRLNKFSEENLLANINNNIVDMIPSFDSETVEPVVLPSKLPMILINGTIGIGAGGFASSIPPHSLESIVDSTIEVLKDPNISLDTLIDDYNLKPSFPYGGLVDISDIKNIYSTGKGNFTTRALIEKDVTDKKYDKLIIKELPYGTTVINIIDGIKKVHNDPKLKETEKFIGLKGLEDHSFKKDVKIVLFFTKGTNLDISIRQLYNKTKLQSFVSYNPNLIKDENTLIEYTNIKDIITDWISFRRKTVKREKMNKIRDIEKRIHILKAVIKIFSNKDNIDIFLDIIRNGVNKQ